MGALRAPTATAKAVMMVVLFSYFQIAWFIGSHAPDCRCVSKSHEAEKECESGLQFRGEISNIRRKHQQIMRIVDLRLFSLLNAGLRFNLVSG